MKFGDAIKSFFKKYATFSGRARRSEYWFAVLFLFIVDAGLNLLFPGKMHDMGWRESGFVSNLWQLAVLIPSLAVGVRRLHDTGRSGAQLLWLLLPVIGWIVLIVKLAEDSKAGANEYGDPVK